MTNLCSQGNVFVTRQVLGLQERQYRILRQIRGGSEYRSETTKAQKRNADLLPVMEAYQDKPDEATSLRAIGAKLNERGIHAPNGGGRWHPNQRERELGFRGDFAALRKNASVQPSDATLNDREVIRLTK